MYIENLAHGIDPDLVHAGVPVVIVRPDQPKIYPSYIATLPPIYEKQWLVY